MQRFAYVLVESKLIFLKVSVSARPSNMYHVVRVSAAFIAMLSIFL